MGKQYFFFERKRFEPAEGQIGKDSGKAYYNYLGYKRESDDICRYPISIYFGKDEISVHFTRKDLRILKIFSLYAAAGTINQSMLSKKIENYALMPLWPLSKNSFKGEIGEIFVDPVLLGIGFFPSYYGFEYNKQGFSESELPGSRSDIIQINDSNTLKFVYGRGEERDIWTIEDSKISVERINFSKILLDFLFELDFANTFEDENFFRLQPILQNNPVLDALTKKCRYLAELNNQKDFEQKTRKPKLPKPFQEVEREWLNVCRIENYKPIFTSPNSLFDDPEIEVKNVYFKARIGKGRRRRTDYLRTKDDALLKNQICTFFMRKYDIWGAFRVLMPTGVVVLVPLILLAIPLGDLILSKSQSTKPMVGLFSIVLPIVVLSFIILCQVFRGLNLFKLLLPRLFLGILLGWSVFWSTEELWKRALTTAPSIVLIFDLFLLIVIFMYIFTDISNRMYKKVDRRVLIKSINLIVMALVLSFVIGFYVIQFFAEPMIENSDFLENPRLYNIMPKMAGTDQTAKDDLLKKIKIDTFFDEFFTDEGEKEQKQTWDWDLKDDIEYIYGKDDHLKGEARGRSDGGPNQYQHHPISLLKNFKKEARIRYIWSVLLSQFVVSILIGIVLQLLWEDRPITEPL